MSGEFAGKVMVVTGAGEGMIRRRKISINKWLKNNDYLSIYIY